MRGSTPAPGQEFVRYGGHTSCVAVRASSTRAPDLVLDAGTGLRTLGALLDVPFDGTVVLTHLHWDHVQGLPFSAALLEPGARARILVPAAQGTTALEALGPGFSPPSFPVRADELADGWSFAEVEPRIETGGWRIRTADVRHKGGRTVGVRVERDGRSLVYIPDHDLAEADDAAVELARGADVLLHDAQYLAAEILPVRHHGHSTVERACAFADAAEVGRLVLTHHAPTRTDDDLDAIAAALRSTPDGRAVEVARQGADVAV